MTETLITAIKYSCKIFQPMVRQLLSNWILLSCQSHRVTSGELNSGHRHMHISKLFSYIYIWFFFSAGPNWQSLTMQQFCCKSVHFLHTKQKKFPLLYTQEAMRAMLWKKCFIYFLLADIFPYHTKMAAKNRNGDTLLFVLEATFYQTKIFRYIQFVCKVATCKSTRKLISGLLSMSVYNNDC